MLRFFIATCFFLAPSFATAESKFIGTLELVPSGCERAAQCTLKNDFGYVDSDGIGWQAKKGLKTDGATIPPWAQPYIGEPFDKRFIKAAIIHDHYCSRHVRPWRKTHWAFYDALLASELDKSTALLMYFAVYLGGPKWIELIKGTACPVGKSCVQKTPGQTWPARSRERKGEDGQRYLFRSAEYNDASFKRHLDDTHSFISERGGQVTLQELEMRAHAAKPEDFFFLNPESITTRPAPQVTK